MIILEHSTYDASNIAKNLGAPEYSYWFVRKAFRPVLKRFGTVVPIAVPEREADTHFLAAQARGEEAVLLSYNPPNYTPSGLSGPIVPVFAWEFDRIPDESWGANPLEDWRIPLAQTGAAVTHCNAAASAVRRAMGSSYPIWSIPAPIPNRNIDRWQKSRISAPIELRLDGAVALDVGAIDLDLFHQGQTTGMRALRALRHAAADPSRPAQSLSLDGVVYTTVFNPADGRKNWFDMITAFVWALRHNPDATLVLKLTHAHIVESMLSILEHVAKLGSFACRVVLLHGLLPDEAYGRLIDATTYAVNASSGEGQCLPLMEFMAAGRPAVAPCHSAMLDYIAPDNAFIVASHAYPASWPHDERQATRCLRHKIMFDDLVHQFRESYRVAKTDPGRYAAMSAAATAALNAFCSDAVITDRLTTLFDHVSQSTKKASRGSLSTIRPEERPRLTNPFVPNRADPYQVGVDDAILSGWYNHGANELAPGFTITPADIIVDVGCGDGGPVSFCARRGAHIILADVDAERLGHTATAIRALPAKQVDAYVTDSTPLPLENETATRVICMEVLEHVDDPKRVVDELVRVGKPNALYLVSVPGAASEHLQKQLAPPGYFEKPNHVRIFERGVLRQLIEDSGLVVEYSGAFGFYWSLLLAIFWQTGVPLGETHPMFETWASTWSQVLAGKDGLRIKTALDEMVPRVQFIVARKPA